MSDEEFEREQRRMAEQIVRHMKRGKRPREGDIFAFELRGTGWVFGRVIDTEAESGLGKANLIYLFKHVGATREDVPSLAVDNLLVPPMITPDQGWTTGHFLTLRNEPIRGGERLRQHCFEWVGRTPTWYVDERGKRLPCRVDPCGWWGSLGFVATAEEARRAFQTGRGWYGGLPGTEP